MTDGKLGQASTSLRDTGQSPTNKGKERAEASIVEMDAFTQNVEAVLMKRFDEFETRVRAGLKGEYPGTGGEGGNDGNSRAEVPCTPGKSQARTKDKPRSATDARGKNFNYFNSDLRLYLKSMKLHFDPEKGAPLLATEEELQTFETEGDGTGPEIPTTDDGAMPMEWTKLFLSSEWNKRAIALLTFDFLGNLQRGVDRKENALQCEYDSKTMTKDHIRTSITANLKTVNSKVNKDQETLKLYFERRGKRGRAVTRRKTRRKSRKYIVSNMASDDSPIEPEERKLWKDAEEVLDVLDLDGTSGDETDAEETRKQREKVVRRLDQRFLCPEVVELKGAIDTYEQFLDDEEGNNKTKQGNRPLRRIREAVKEDGRNYMEKLPVNFYNSEWYKSRSIFQKREIAAAPAITVPHIDPYVPN